MKTVLTGVLSPKFMGLNVDMVTKDGIAVKDLKTFMEVLRPYNKKLITLTVCDDK